MRGVQHDPLLYGYLLDPTYSTYGLREMAFRKFNLKLGPSPAEAADITLRLTEKLSDEVDKAGLRKVYDDIDLPLVPVLARMEEAGVKLDCDVLAEMSRRLERDIDAKAREIYDKCGFRVQHQFAQATGRRAVQQAEPAQADQVWQGQDHLDCRRCAGGTGGRARSSEAWCWTIASSPS